MTNLMGLTINSSEVCSTALDIDHSLSSSRAKWGSVPNEWRLAPISSYSWCMPCYIAPVIQVTQGLDGKRGYSSGVMPVNSFLRYPYYCYGGDI